MASSMALFSRLIGLSSSIGVATAASCSPMSISSLSFSASSFSRMVRNSTSAEITISTEAMMKGISMTQILRSASGALM